MALRETALDALQDEEDEVSGDARVYRLPLAAARFSALELQVIALARHDTLGSLEAPGLIDRLAAVLFGTRRRRRALADERLEALRQAVVLIRHRHHLPDAMALALREAGFNPAQVAALEPLALRD
jgi:alkylhydroperoxidase family enzyme